MPRFCSSLIIRIRLSARAFFQKIRFFFYFPEVLWSPLACQLFLSLILVFPGIESLFWAILDSTKVRLPRPPLDPFFLGTVPVRCLREGYRILCFSFFKVRWDFLSPFSHPPYFFGPMSAPPRQWFPSLCLF